jgi:hypothetical protein
VAESINAGLDLEMPGVDKWRTLDHTTRSVGSRKIIFSTLKERATKVLELVQKCAKAAPEVRGLPSMTHRAPFFNKKHRSLTAITSNARTTAKRTTH